MDLSSLSAAYSGLTTWVCTSLTLFPVMARIVYISLHPNVPTSQWVQWVLKVCGYSAECKFTYVKHKKERITNCTNKPKTTRPTAVTSVLLPAALSDFPALFPHSSSLCHPLSTVAQLSNWHFISFVCDRWLRLWMATYLPNWRTKKCLTLSQAGMPLPH